MKHTAWFKANATRYTASGALAVCLITTTACRNDKAVQNTLQRMSDFSLLTLQGKPASLAPFQGQVVLLDVWATWCPPCRESMPDLQEVHDKFKSKGATVVGVCLDKNKLANVGLFLKQHHISFPVLLDTNGNTSLQRGLDIQIVPTLYLIDRNGQIARRWQGADVDPRDLETAVITALSQPH